MPEKIDFEAIWGDEEERAKKLRAALGLTDDTTTEVDAEAEPESAAQLIGVPVGDLMQLLDAALFAYRVLRSSTPT